VSSSEKKGGGATLIEGECFLERQILDAFSKGLVLLKDKKKGEYSRRREDSGAYT